VTHEHLHDRPAVVNAAPTIAASSTRGSLIFHMIASAVEDCGCPARWSNTTRHTVIGAMPTDPTATPAVIAAANSTAQTSSTDDGQRPAARDRTGDLATPQLADARDGARP
jgi:hypothetical protein